MEQYHKYSDGEQNLYLLQNQLLLVKNKKQACNTVLDKKEIIDKMLECIIPLYKRFVFRIIASDLDKKSIASDVFFSLLIHLQKDKSIKIDNFRAFIRRLTNRRTADLHRNNKRHCYEPLDQRSNLQAPKTTLEAEGINASWSPRKYGIYSIEKRIRLFNNIISSDKVSFTKREESTFFSCFVRLMTVGAIAEKHLLEKRSVEKYIRNACSKIRKQGGLMKFDY